MSRPQTPPEIPRRRWIRLAQFFLVYGAAALWLGPRADPDAWWLHGAWCLIGIAVALPTISVVFRSGFGLVLTDHRLMFLSAFTLYFLFGASLPAIGPEADAQASMSHFPIDARMALRVDGVNGIGFGIALLAATYARGRWLGAQAAKAAAFVSRVPATRVIGVLLVAGIGVSAWVNWADMRGSDTGLPGVVRNLGQLSLVAIFMAASRVGSGERALRALAVIGVIVLGVVNAMQFNKSGVLLPMAALVAGLAMRFDARKVLPVGVAVLVAGFFGLGNLTNVGRISSERWQATTLAEYWDRLKDAWQAVDTIEEGQQYSYWGRLCYVPTAAAGLQFQDEGRGGDGMRLMLWVAVPRFLAPQKPEITKTGRELYEKITGRDTSADGQGIFASGYYHGGWWGFLLASALCGWVLAQTSAIARAIQAQRGLLLLPLSLLGLFIAFRIDGDFVSDYLGAFMFILYPLLAAAVFLPARAVAQR